MPAPAPLSKYWFVLGRETYISAAEIATVLGLKNYQLGGSILKVDGLSLRGARDEVIPQLAQPYHGIATSPEGRLAMTNSTKDLIKKLGGTIKIAVEMASQVKQSDIEELIITKLKTVSGKINFGISIYSNERNDFNDLKLAEELGKKIKKTLKAEGLSVRYVENREPVLSSVTVEKNGLTGRGREFLIEKNGNYFSLAKTEAVQPFEEFSARDFGRPGRDDLSGMLPPKLAMMMINLSQTPTTSTLLDPFCGSGTILSEALLLGYTNLIGTDISEKAISDSKENIEWIAQKFQITNFKLQIKFQLSDIKNINQIIPDSSIDSIVTEPYMGHPLKGNERREDLIKQAGELKNLYLQAFSKFAKILKPKGRVVFLIPRFKYQNDWIQIDCQKEIQQLGFKIINFFEDRPSLLYARPNQRVAREIWGFEKK